MGTKIEWAAETWNPITGCSPVSEGCANCYAKRMAQRFRGRYGYPADDPFKVTFHPDRLDQPSRWRKPRMIFVCSMGDLFHEDVPDESIAEVFGALACRSNQKHVFIVLTKRPKRMRDFITRCKPWEGWVTHNGEPIDAYGGSGIVVGYKKEEMTKDHQLSGKPRLPMWPIPNLYLGVTAENQKAADERIPALLQIPASVRFVSVEPMLGPVNITSQPWWDWRYSYNFYPKGFVRRPLDWVICGGETGPGARPIHPDWPRALRDQCQEAGVPFFFKQWGEWIHDTHKPYKMRRTWL